MLSTHKPVREIDASDQIDRIFHDIKQTLRITGIPLPLRTWAASPAFFTAIWEAMRDNVETQAFEDAAQQVRLTAVHGAARLGKPQATARLDLGESEAFQIRAALDTYYYTNPKLLLFTLALRRALENKPFGTSTPIQPEKIERGIPPAMFPMEMEDEQPEDVLVGAIFNDIRHADRARRAGGPRSESTRSIHNDFRTLALWPGYLDAAWRALKPISARADYERETEAIRSLAARQAAALPLPIQLALDQNGEDIVAITESIHEFEHSLPRLILNVALLQLDWKDLHFLEISPFPARLRQTRPVEAAA